MYIILYYIICLIPFLFNQVLPNSTCSPGENPGRPCLYDSNMWLITSSIAWFLLFLIIFIRYRTSLKLTGKTRILNGGYGVSFLFVLVVMNILLTPILPKVDEDLWTPILGLIISILFIGLTFFGVFRSKGIYGGHGSRDIIA